MSTPNLKQVQTKVSLWRAEHPERSFMPADLKRDILALLKTNSLTRVGKELGLPLSTLSGWQKQGRRHKERKKQDVTPKFIELTPKRLRHEPPQQLAMLMLRRRDGSLLEVQGALTDDQLRSLSITFFGGMS